MRLASAALEEGRRHQIAAIDQRGHRHHRLDRRDIEALAEGDRHGVQFAPVLGHQRLGAFRQFRAQTVELAHLPQEGLVALDADHQRHARRADVGGMGEHLRHGQHAMGRVEIVDREASVAQAVARIDARAQIDLAGIERHGDRQRLEGRAHLVDADIDAVDARRVLGHVGGIVGIEVGQRLQGDDFAGVDVDDRAGAGLGAKARHARGEFVAQRMRRLQIERQAAPASDWRDRC